MTYYRVCDGELPCMVEVEDQQLGSFADKTDALRHYLEVLQQHRRFCSEEIVAVRIDTLGNLF